MDDLYKLFINIYDNVFFSFKLKGEPLIGYIYNRPISSKPIKFSNVIVNDARFTVAYMVTENRPKQIRSHIYAPF